MLAVWIPAFVAALVVGVIFGVLKRPREWVRDSWRAGRGKPYSELHAVLVGQIDPTWSVQRQTADGPQLSFQCRLNVTNGGNRTDAPVRGELRWNGHTTTFTTPLSALVYGVRGRVLDLAPNASAILTLNAWIRLTPSDDPKGDLRTEIVLFDRFEGSHKTRVTFRPIRQAVVPPGKCGHPTVKDDEFMYCDQGEGHDGDHSHRDESTGIVTSWGDDGTTQDFLVM